MNAFRVDFDCDIYVTGSNAYLLSSEYSTYLSGRCVEIKMLSLSFREFLDFHGFEIRQTQSALGGTRKQVVDGNGAQYDLRDAFQAFLRFGGMLGIAEVGLDQEKAMTLLDGIYSTVVMRDILERESDPALPHYFTSRGQYWQQHFCWIYSSNTHCLKAGWISCNRGRDMIHLVSEC